MFGVRIKSKDTFLSFLVSCTKAAYRRRYLGFDRILQMWYLIRQSNKDGRPGPRLAAAHGACYTISPVGYCSTVGAHATSLEFVAMQLSSATNLACLAIPLWIAALAGGAEVEHDSIQWGKPVDPVRPVWLIKAEDQGGMGICYGPYRDGQRPGESSPSVAQIREDLQLMAGHCSYLRTYASSEFAQILLEQIRDTGLDMQVMLGVWIAAEEERDKHGQVVTYLAEAADANRRECDAAIALAADFPYLVKSICVGNETQVDWSPYPCPLELLIDKIRLVREAVSVPVTTADDYQYWLSPESRMLAREIDFITVHAHPLWNGKKLDEALPWLRAQLDAVAAAHPQRPVVIGETGWATSMADSGEEARLIKGRPGEAEQAVFYRAVSAWAAAQRIPLFIFEAFDENWKGGDDPAEVEKHWGLYRADRSAKKALAAAAEP
jgi:exo-beta-1,3-glucanase (GH17 family)